MERNWNFPNAKCAQLKFPKLEIEAKEIVRKPLLFTTQSFFLFPTKRRGGGEMEGNDPGKKCINMAGIKQTSHFKQNHLDMSHINEADDIRASP